MEKTEFLTREILSKKALIENTNIRTNWIVTIEKLLRCYKLTHVPEKKFKNKSKLFIPSYFVTQWKNKLLNEDISRLATYKLINDDFSFPKHLGLPYHLRKVISRIRCSNHPLEIEKGRHKNPKTPRQERLCKLCYDQVVEDEDHFLLRCTTYSHLRDHYQINQDNVPDVLNMEDQYRLAKFLLSAYELRERLFFGRARD